MPRQVPKLNPQARIAFNDATLTRLRGTYDPSEPGSVLGGGIIGKLRARLMLLEARAAELEQWNSTLKTLAASGVATFRDIDVKECESRDEEPDPLPDTAQVTAKSPA